MTTARALLRTVDGLSYHDRQRLLADHGRRLGGAELLGLLDELHGQGEFARRIALTTAGIAGERRYVERCLSGVETSVLTHALKLAVRLSMPVDVLVARLPSLPSALRVVLYQEVRRDGVTTLAEALLPVARARFGDREAAQLLPVCQPETIAALLPELDYAVTGWRRIAHWYPHVFLDYLDAALAATPRSGWGRLLGTVGGGLVTAALAAPDRVLDVLERAVPHAPLPVALGRVLGALGRHNAPRLLGVLLHPRRTGVLPGGRTLWRALLDTNAAELAVLGRSLPESRRSRFLRTAPPGQRADVYAGMVGGRTPAEAGLPMTVLDLLPAESRFAEARRLLGLRTVTDDPAVRLEVTARLPWTEAREPLRVATGRTTPQERAAAYMCLIAVGAASRDPEVFADMLGLLSRLRNEQGPVRHDALQALTKVPPWLFRTADPSVVIGFVTDVAQARDCSRLTEQLARRLAGRLVREGALTGDEELVDTGLRGFAAFDKSRSWPWLEGLGEDPPRGTEHQMFEALRPQLENDARDDRFGLLLQLAAGLGSRAWAMPGMRELLDRARKAADDRTVREATELWLDPPATRDERLAEVFHADRSTITIKAVASGIGWRRTDLLDEVFRKPLHGRFLKKGVRHVPRFAGCFHRWLPRQVERYASLVGEVAASRTEQPWKRVQAVHQLRQGPGAADRLRALLADEDVTVVEAALEALAWTEEPAQVLPDLLAHANDDRAKVAIYAASRGARFVPPAQLAAALAPALVATKVTARKEAVRLLALHHAEGAVETVMSEWSTPDQHRDIRRALVFASLHLLADERVWPLLADAVNREHEVATAVLGVDPHFIAERHRPRYASLVRTVAEAEDADTARLGLAALSAWIRWCPEGMDLLTDRVTDLTSTATWLPALGTLVNACATIVDPTPLRTVTTHLAAADVTVDGRDLPARQRLLALTKLVCDAAVTSPVLRHAATDLATTLADAPTLRRPAIELAIAAVPLEAGAEDVDALLRVVEMADTPVWAWHAHDTLRTTLTWQGRVARVPQAHLHDLATILAARTGPAAPLLALAIVTSVGEETGWSPGWRELIYALRRHPDTEVSLAALDTFTVAE